MSANEERSSAVKIKSNIVKLFSLPPSAFGSHLIRLCLRSATLSRAKSRPWRLRSKQRLRALAPQGEGLARHERKCEERLCVNPDAISKSKHKQRTPPMVTTGGDLLKLYRISCRFADKSSAISAKGGTLSHAYSYCFALPNHRQFGREHRSRLL